MTRKFLTIPAVVAGALGMGSSIAWAAEPSTQELMDQIKQLQSKVAEMENRQTTLSDAQVSATIDSVLRDAEKRSQLFQMEGFTAGHDGKNFWLKSADGAYSLSPRFQFQFRHTVNWSDEQKGDGDASLDKGFEIRRMKFTFLGTVCSPDLSYNFRFAADRDGGGVTLENAYLQYQFNDQWAFKVGQWKDNVFHEESTSSEKQLAADRSFMNEILAGGLTDYVQGASLIYNPTDSPFRAEIAAHDGANSDNTTWQDEGGVPSVDLADPNWGASVRVEWAMNNNFKGYDDFTARGNTEGLLVIGGGANYTQAGDVGAYFHTVDAQWENNTGLGMYAAYVGTYRDGGADSDDVYNWGFLYQVGYMLNDRWEIFGRLDWVDVDEDFAIGTLSGSSTHEYTVGVNYYFCEGHGAKFTLDVGYLPNGSPVDLDGIGVLATEEDQFYVRGQFQLLI